MESLTLVYKGSIAIESPPQRAVLNASRFERGYLTIDRHWGPKMGHDAWGIRGNTRGSDEQGSETSVDAAAIGFLERNKDVLVVAIEGDLRSRLPRSCAVTVEIGFWKGSIAFAATIVLLIGGKYYATQETLNYIRVAVGPSISRILRRAVDVVAEAGTNVAVLASLDASSVAQIEQLQKTAKRKLDQFDRRTTVLSKHVYYRGLAILFAGLLAVIVALMFGAPIMARWWDALWAL